MANSETLKKVNWIEYEDRHAYKLIGFITLVGCDLCKHCLYIPDTFEPKITYSICMKHQIEVSPGSICKDFEEAN